MGAGLSRGAAPAAGLSSPISTPQGASASMTAAFAIMGGAFGVGSWMSSIGEKLKQLDDRSIANDLEIIANGKQIAALVAQGQSTIDMNKLTLTALTSIATEVSIYKTGQSSITSNLVSCRHPSPRRMASATTPATFRPALRTPPPPPPPRPTYEDCGVRLQEALAKSIKDSNDALGKSIMDSNDTLGKSIKAEKQMTQETIQECVDDLKDVVGLLRDLATTPPVLPPRP